MAIKKELSLLPDSENPNSFSARVIKWLTTVGRWVIVFTELVVVSAFISRFWLDRQNSDLSETLRQQQAILESTQSFESEFKSFQQRLDFIADFYQNDPQYDQKITALINSTPKDLVYQTLSIKKDEDSKNVSAVASLIAFNETSIITFINNLTLNPNIETIKINQIEKKQQENNYSINISVVFKEVQKV
jgi:Tfp pilus assembly protein PilN